MSLPTLRSLCFKSIQSPMGAAPLALVCELFSLVICWQWSWTLSLQQGNPSMTPGARSGDWALGVGGLRASNSLAELLRCGCCVCMCGGWRGPSGLPHTPSQVGQLPCRVLNDAQDYTADSVPGILPPFSPCPKRTGSQVTSATT